MQVSLSDLDRLPGRLLAGLHFSGGLLAFLPVAFVALFQDVGGLDRNVGGPAPRLRDVLLDRLLSALALSFIIGVFLPFVVYYLNFESVDLPFSTIVIGGLVTLAAAVPLLWLSGLLPAVGSGLSAAYRVMAVAAFFLVVFPNRTGEMAGVEDFLAGAGNALPVAKLLLLVLASGLLLRYRPDIFRTVLLFAAGSAVIFCLFVSLYVYSRTSQAPVTGQDKSSFAALGQTRNVVVLVLDSFTGFTAREALQDRPALRDALQGFTLYPRALSSARNTPAGLATILTGDLEIAVNETDRIKHNNRMMRESFLRDARDAGYDIAYVSAAVWPTDRDWPVLKERDFFDPPPQTLASRYAEYRGFFFSSAARVLPPALARRIERRTSGTKRGEPVNDAPGFWKLYRSATSSSRRASIAGRLALDHFATNVRVAGQRPKVIFFHSNYTHPPWSFGEDGTYQETAAPAATAVAGLSALARVVAKLKALEILDKTLVIAVSDHGGMSVSDTTLGGLVAPWDRSTSVYNPLVMVRPPGAGAPFRESEMTVWLGDIAATVRDFIGVPATSSRRYDTRSLIGPPDLTRKVRLPLFIRPARVSFHDAFRLWDRLDWEGDFAHFMSSVGAYQLRTTKQK